MEGVLVHKGEMIRAIVLEVHRPHLRHGLHGREPALRIMHHHHLFLVVPEDVQPVPDGHRGGGPGLAALRPACLGGGTITRPEAIRAAGVVEGRSVFGGWTARSDQWSATRTCPTQSPLLVQL